LRQLVKEWLLLWKETWANMTESYTKAKLVTELAGLTTLSKAAVGRVLDCLTEIAYREAANGFVVPGICKLKVVRKKAARRRNPVTGKLFLIGERLGLKMLPLKKAKAAITPNTDVVVQMLEEPAPDVILDGSSAATQTVPDAQAPVGAAKLPEASSSVSASTTVLAGGEDGQIVFPCSECGSMLAAVPKTAGQTGECPFCNAKTTIPSRQPEAAKPEKQVLDGHGGGAAVSDFILFVCRACGQEIEAPSDMVGMNVECPLCSTSLTVPIAGSEPASGDAGKTKPEPMDAAVNRSSMTIRIDLSDLE